VSPLRFAPGSRRAQGGGRIADRSGFRAWVPLHRGMRVARAPIFAQPVPPAKEAARGRLGRCGVHPDGGGDRALCAFTRGPALGRRRRRRDRGGGPVGVVGEEWEAPPRCARRPPRCAGRAIRPLPWPWESSAHPGGPKQEQLLTRRRGRRHKSRFARFHAITFKGEVKCYLPQAASRRAGFLPARHVSGRCLQQGESPVLGEMAVEGDGVGDTQARHDHEAHGVAE